MFTGIIEALGTVAEVKRNEDMQLLIQTGSLDMNDVKLGDSIAVNGVCLTATGLLSNGFWADVSRETLTHTTLTDIKPGTQVNLEKALTPSSRLGGHMVSGHVDGVGKLLEMQDDGRSTRLKIQAPSALMRYIAAKGSVCVDGISLTVNRVDRDSFELGSFEVNIVPHTLEQTLIKYYSVGRPVNLEVDLIARYLERLLTTEADSNNSNDPDTRSDAEASTSAGAALSKEFLAQHGFLR